MAIDTTKKIKQVTYNGKDIPLRGYDTSDATVTAGDMARNVIAYGNGGKVTGTVTTVKSGFTRMYTADTIESSAVATSYVFSSKTLPAAVLLRSGAIVQIRQQCSSFGDATAADVRSGKTFTSAAGLKVVGTAAGSSAADVTFDLYNNGFAHLVAVYISKTDGVMNTTIPNSDHRSITTSEGSMVVLINQEFSGDTINLIPDNGVSIAQGWRMANVTMFVAGAETNGMNIDVEIV